MDLQQELTSQHSKESRDRITAYINRDPTRFAVLFDLFKNGNSRISQRSAWSVSYCAEKFPELILPYYREMIDYLTKEQIHDSIKRNILRTLEKVEIPEHFEGELLELGFGFLENKKEAVVIRVFSMQLLANLSIRYPEIQQELRLIIEHELPYAKPAFVSRGEKILRQFSARVKKRS